MKKLSTILCVILLCLVVILNGCWCNEETTTGDDEIMAPMEIKEKQALYSAIQGFVGNWWNGSDLYPDPCGWTPIQGVSCDLTDGFWYVTDLSIGPLHDNSLTCAQKTEFRPQLFELNHLKLLSFFNCFTSHHDLITLPSSTKHWEKLAESLKSLEFRSNPSLIGPIPSIFGNLLNLQSLVLIENGFTGKLLPNIGNLVHLKRLVISGNKISGQIPDNIGSLRELLILDLSRNSVSGYLPSSIGYLSSLLKLDLSNNLLGGNIPIEIGMLKNLTLLDFRNNSFSGGLTKSLESMKSLQELVISNNPKLGGDMQILDWKKLENLVILELSNVGLRGEVAESLAGLKKLRYVGLANNNLTGNLPTTLANMPCVSAIYVNGNNLTGELKFSEGFYGKLGRRFGAWNNPYLCYPQGLMSSGHAPLGVDPCKSEEINMVDPVLKIALSDQQQRQQQQQQQQQRQPSVDPEQHDEVSRGYGNRNSEIIASNLGLSNSGIEGVWWVFLVEIVVMVLLWNCISI